MTIYYINPASGADSNTGLSWAQAWKTFRGLRVQSKVPVAGDELRIAKSSEFTPPGPPEVETGWDYPDWYFRGVHIFDAFSDVLGSTQFASLSYDTGVQAGQARKYVSVSGGVVTPDMPAGSEAYDAYYASVHATAYAGEYNATGTTLFTITLGSSSSSSMSGVSGMTGWVRCHVPYTGAGTQDLPAGAITLSFYRDATLIANIALPSVRNSDTEWTPFSATFSAQPAVAASAMSVVVRRTGAALARDNSAFGLEFTEFGINKGQPIGYTDTVIGFDRTPPTYNYGSGQTSEIAGNENVKVFCEWMNAGDTYGLSSTLTLPTLDYLRRIPHTPARFIRAYAVTDVSLTGVTALSPAGSQGVFDLNGSLGGSVASPVLITGGWDTATDTVTGSSIFSAGMSHKLPSSFSLLDLNGADHVRVENVGACYGFASLFTRAKSVYLKGCMLPWALTPSAFGTATVDTHVTLEDMYVNPYILDGFGTIGDLTLKNTVGNATTSHSKARRAKQVRNLLMVDSHVSNVYGLDIRGDAVFDGCALMSTMSLNQLEFGHTLEVKNVKPLQTYNDITGALVGVSDNSRWDSITYRSTASLGYRFATATTGVSCVALVVFEGGDVPWASSGTVYPTSLRGDSALQTYTDGVNEFSSDGSAAAQENSPRGHTYGHMMGTRLPYRDADDPVRMSGDLLTPPWATHVHQDLEYVRETVNQPDVAFAGQVYLVKRLSNVQYRTNDSLFIMTGRTPGVVTWRTLKALYVKKAGNYRAHFGCMKENLYFSFYRAGGRMDGGFYVPLRMGIPSFPVSTGRLLGKLGVHCNTMIGRTKTLDYYESTEDDVAKGGGNLDLDQWHDYYIDFSLSGAGLVELRLRTGYGNAFPMNLFDILNIYELP